MENQAGLTLAYVFHLSPSGFIAVSADTDLPPVIGYSFLNNFMTENIWQNIGFSISTRGHAIKTCCYFPYS